MKYFRILLVALIVFMSLNLFSEEYQKLTAEGKKYLRSANMHLGGGRFEKALPLYLSVVEENPNHIEALENLAGIYYDTKNEYYNASEYLDLAIISIDKEIDAYKAIITEKPKKEKSINKKIKPLTEEKVRLLNIKKGCWVNLFKQARAKFAFANEYYSMNPETLDLTDTATIENLNNMLVKIGPDTIAEDNPMTIEDINAKFSTILDESILDFETLHNFAPDSTNTIKMLAFAYEVQGDEGKQIEYFIKAFEVNPSDDVVCQKLGNIFFNNEDHENAIIWFEKARDIKPESIDNYNNLGIVYTALGNEEKAMENYEEVVKVNPEDMNTIVKISNLAAKLNNIDKSIEYLKKAVDLDPENIDFLKFLSYRLYSEKRYEETMEFAQKWYDLDSTSKEAASLVYQSANENGNQDVKAKFEEILKQQ